MSIELTRSESIEILRTAKTPVSGGLPLDISDELGRRITMIEEGQAHADAEGKTLSTDTFTVDFDPFPKSMLKAYGMKFGQEWFTGAMRKMFDSNS